MAAAAKCVMARVAVFVNVVAAYGLHQPIAWRWLGGWLISAYCGPGGAFILLYQPVAAVGVFGTASVFYSIRHSYYSFVAYVAP